MTQSIDKVIKKQAYKIVKEEMEGGEFDEDLSRKIEKSHSRILGQKLRQLKDIKNSTAISSQRLASLKRSQAGMNDAVSSKFVFIQESIYIIYSNQLLCIYIFS